MAGRLRPVLPVALDVTSASFRDGCHLHVYVLVLIWQRSELTLLKAVARKGFASRDLTTLGTAWKLHAELVNSLRASLEDQVLLPLLKHMVGDTSPATGLVGSSRGVLDASARRLTYALSARDVEGSTAASEDFCLVCEQLLYVLEQDLIGGLRAATDLQTQRQASRRMLALVERHRAAAVCADVFSTFGKQHASLSKLVRVSLPLRLRLLHPVMTTLGWLDTSVRKHRLVYADQRKTQTYRGGDLKPTASAAPVQSLPSRFVPWSHN